MNNQNILFEKTIELGKGSDNIWYLVNIKLRKIHNPGHLTTDLVKCDEFIELSVTAEGYNSKISMLKRSDRGCISFGCMHDLDKYYTDTKVHELMNLARKYHLNGMKAGTKEQNKHVEEYCKSRSYEKNSATGRRPLGREYVKESRPYEYGKVCEYLKDKGIYEVSGPHGEKYKYGHSWLVEILPTEVIDRIKSF